MEKNPASIKLENFIDNWNNEFPDYLLSPGDLKKPLNVMGALFQLFDRLGIHRDFILAPPPEEICNDHIIYYWDLLPVINMTRVINYLMSFTPRTTITISINYLVQPLAIRSHSILLVLLNLMLFNENRLVDIRPDEEALFSKTNQVKTLEDKKNKLLIMLNEQAEEKGKRGERRVKLDNDIKQLEDESKMEKVVFDENQQELEAVLKENKQIDIALEQKKGQRDGLLAEIEKKQALRVYDADDIKAQAEQAAQNVHDAEEKLKSLRETLMQKENSLKNLQIIKPNLHAADNLLRDIIKQWESLRDYENGDLDTDSKEGELDVLNTELSELEVQLAELRAARADAAKKRQEAHAKRQQDRTLAQSNFRDAEEKNKKCVERCKRVAQRTQEIKAHTARYEQEKAEGLEELANIRNTVAAEVKAINATLLKKAVDVKNEIEEKLRISNVNLVNYLHVKPS